MKRRLVVGALALTVALVVFVVVWFEPQALFLDDRVDEAAPTVAVADAGPGTTAGSVPGASTPTADAQPVAGIVARGALRGIEGHDLSAGEAQLHRVADGSHVLRLEGLDAENGPDLKVYLSSAPDDGDPDALDDDFVNLGDLKGNIGSSNYDVPTDVDLERYTTAVIWCERFSVGFAVAGLIPAAPG